MWPLWLLAALLIAGGAAAAYVLEKPKKDAVPRVVNEPINVAQTQIQNAGFTPNIVYRTDVHAKDIVIGQVPLAGQKVGAGATVTLTVSSGPGPATVPSIQDLPKNLAVKAIARAGLTVGRIVQQPSSTVNQGAAINTDPGAGTPLQVGTGVTLFISSGPAPVNVPSVVGDTKAAAQATLGALNIQVNFTPQPSATDPPNTVISQSATGKVTAGSAVTVTIATAPTMVAVPPVTGLTAAKAESSLKAAGFKVSRSTTDVTDKTQNGVVISQSPAANSQAQKNGTVTIVVGKYKKPTQTTTTTTPTTTTTTTPTTTTTTTTTP
jgi:serine/threonine-protein kinase